MSIRFLTVLVVLCWASVLMMALAGCSTPSRPPLAHQYGWSAPNIAYDGPEHVDDLGQTRT